MRRPISAVGTCRGARDMDVKTIRELREQPISISMEVRLIGVRRRPAEHYEWEATVRELLEYANRVVSTWADVGELLDYHSDGEQP